MNIELIEKAAKFAKVAHTGQKRKYTGDDYIKHPVRVATKVLAYCLDSVCLYNEQMQSAMISAALLHDVVEDCNIQLSTIEDEFGLEIANLVKQLTNECKKEQYPELNRKERKALECKRIELTDKAAKIIKLCDRIDNLMDIPKGESFVKKYCYESRDLLEVLRGSDDYLENQLENLIKERLAE